MKRVPIVPTVIVALAVAAMIALGVWQLQRLHWKEALLAQYAANEHRPPIAFPRNPVNDALLFRRATGMCVDPAAFKVEGAGNAGFRVIASCRTGAEGPGMKVQLGTTHDAMIKPHWGGGALSGFISHAPDHTPLIAMMVGKAGPQELMLVADQPAPGLSANPGPDLSAVPNNHLAYAVQWFLFALVATVIYALALRRRWRGPVATPPERG